MGKTGKAVAWIYIFSTLLMGCYSTTLINAKGDEKEKIYANGIIYVVTKEGRKYVFETPPVIRNDTVVGEATIDYGYIVRREVAIPVIDVGYVSVAENKTLTVLTVLGVVALVGLEGLEDKATFEGTLYSSRKKGGPCVVAQGNCTCTLVLRGEESCVCDRDCSMKRVYPSPFHGKELCLSESGESGKRVDLT